MDTDPNDKGESLPEPANAFAPARPEIQVVVGLETLLGLSDDPAEIPGLGPIPAQTARELAADGTWRAWVTDATGAVARTGSRGYVPSASVARSVRAREPFCRMPGCRHPAEPSTTWSPTRPDPQRPRTLVRSAGGITS